MTKTNILFNNFKDYCINELGLRLLTIEDSLNYYKQNIYSDYAITWDEWLEKSIEFINYRNAVIDEMINGGK